MELNALKPAPSEGRGVVRGVLLSVFMHPIALVLKKDGGYEIRTRDILKPGVRVAVDYSQDRGKPPDSASIVRVYEEGARR